MNRVNSRNDFGHVNSTINIIVVIYNYNYYLQVRRGRQRVLSAWPIILRVLRWPRRPVCGWWPLSTALPLTQLTGSDWCECSNVPSSQLSLHSWSLGLDVPAAAAAAAVRLMMTLPCAVPLNQLIKLTHQPLQCRPFLHRPPSNNQSVHQTHSPAPPTPAWPTVKQPISSSNSLASAAHSCMAHHQTTNRQRQHKIYKKLKPGLVTF